MQTFFRKENYFVTIYLIFVSVFISQDLYSQSQIKDLCGNLTEIEKSAAKSAGLDLDEICNKAEGEISLDTLIKKDNSVDDTKILPRSTISEKKNSRSRTISQNLSPPAVSGTKTEPTVENLKPFGYNLFAGIPNTFSPVADVPVSLDYVLGPGDELKIFLYGKTNELLTLTIDREGLIKFPQLGPIGVAGLSFGEAKNVLEERIEQQLIGISASISMGQLRSIKVFVLGEAFKPGSYSISSLSTITHAIFRSGGVNDIASLRNIQLQRGGKIIAILDLYDLLLKGDTSKDLRLLPSDVVFIPPVKELASVNGSITRPAIYELKDSTSVEDLIELAGGTSSKAYLSSARIQRIGQDGFSKIVDLDLTKKEDLKLKIQPGDSLKIDSVVDYKDNVISLSGHIFHQGEFDWKEGMRISDIIYDYRQFPPKVDVDYAILASKSGPLQNVKVRAINLKNIIEKKETKEDLFLSPLDEIKVFSIDSNKSEMMREVLENLEIQVSFPNFPEIVNISGPVRSNGDYPLTDGMRISDLIKASGGITSNYPESEFAILQRESFDKNNQIISVELLNLTKILNDPNNYSKNLLLEPKDKLRIFNLNSSISDSLEVLVNRLKDQARKDDLAKIVSIDGEIKYSGKYPLTNGMTVLDLVKLSGGFTEQAYIELIEVTRLDLSNPNRSETVILTLDYENASETLLLPYDDVNVKTYPEFYRSETVTLQGEFRFPGTYQIKKGEDLLSVIERAGGLTEYADKKASFFSREELKEAEKKEISRLRETLRKSILANQLREPTPSTSSLNAIVEKNPEYAFLALEQLDDLEPQGRLIIDLRKIILKKIEPPKLKGGDFLFVPRPKQEVTVVGEVMRPSSYFYKGKKNKWFYIDKSGGMTKNADKSSIYIVDSSGEIRRQANWFKGSISPGDTIVVPIELDAKPVRGISLFAQITKIIYELSLGAAAINSFENN